MILSAHTQNINLEGLKELSRGLAKENRLKGDFSDFLATDLPGCSISTPHMAVRTES